MQEEFEHLLITHGILKEFNFVKKFDNKYINKIKRKLKKQNLSEKEIENELENILIEDTTEFFNKNTIPGLIPEHENLLEIDEKTKTEIYLLSETCMDHCKSLNLTKEQMILFVQLFVHLAKITNKDIHNFKEKYGLIDDKTDEDDI